METEHPALRNDGPRVAGRSPQVLRLARLLLFGLVLFTPAAWAWISHLPPTPLPPPAPILGVSSTHKPMAGRAIDLLLPPHQPPKEYADVERFRAILILRADHEGSHLDNEGISNALAIIVGASSNGGPAPKYWTDAKAYYDARNFEQTYLRIGWIAHLLQDEAAPAHGANIDHGRWRHDFEWPTTTGKSSGPGDFCEWYATHRSIENFPLLDLGVAEGAHVVIDPETSEEVEPDVYCDRMIRRTRDAITDVVPPPDGALGGPWTKYWINSTDDASRICATQNSAAKGSYGTNRFPDLEFHGNILRNEAQSERDYPPGLLQRPFPQVPEPPRQGRHRVDRRDVRESLQDAPPARGPPDRDRLVARRGTLRSAAPAGDHGQSHYHGARKPQEDPEESPDRTGRDAGGRAGTPYPE